MLESACQTDTQTDGDQNKEFRALGGNPPKGLEPLRLGFGRVCLNLLCLYIVWDLGGSVSLRFAAFVNCVVSVSLRFAAFDSDSFEIVAAKTNWL